MIAIENVNTFVTGVFPDTVADNSTGASTADGFEFIAEYINNSIIGPQQAMMDYAGLTPDGVTESASASQMIEAIQKGNAVGPGWVGRRDIFDSPAVNGDRSLILSEQGVLIATYPELDAATWIGGNTAAQIAAAAAGGKYYRSSDAGGATGDAAGPWLQLPAGPSPTTSKQYSQAGGDFTITGTNWTTLVANAIPYQESTGLWRLKFNIGGTISAGSNNIVVLTFSGVNFFNIASFDQAVTLYDEQTFFRAADQFSQAHAQGQTQTINIEIASSVLLTNYWGLSGDVALNSKPTWADDFEPVYAITF